VSNSSISPDYPSDFTAKNKTYTFHFADTWGDGVRIIGKSGGAARFTTLSELEVYNSFDNSQDIYADYNFTYDPITGVLDGYLYTKHPDVVRLGTELNNGSVSNIPYMSQDGVLYDDNNQPYVRLNYHASVGSSLSKIILSGGQQKQEWAMNDMTGPYHFDNKDAALHLDAYRMQGSEMFQTVTANTYMLPGQSLISFTPSETVSDSVYGIELAFPINQLEAAHCSGIWMLVICFSFNKEKRLQRQSLSAASS
jgi:hypothetical protein